MAFVGVVRHAENLKDSETLFVVERLFVRLIERLLQEADRFLTLEDAQSRVAFRNEIRSGKLDCKAVVLRFAQIVDSSEGRISARRNPVGDEGKPSLAVRIRGAKRFARKDAFVLFCAWVRSRC